MDNTKSWISIGPDTQPDLEALTARNVQNRIQAADYSWDNVKYIEKVSLIATSENIDISRKRLEQIRALCGIWDVRLHAKEITSHRKFIGPFIVSGKKIFFRIVEVLLRDFVRQQKSFNAGILALVTDLTNTIEKEQKDKK